MARSLNIKTKTRILFLIFVCVAGTVAASVVSRPSGAASSNGSSNNFVGTGLPWWKKTLGHLKCATGIIAPATVVLFQLEF